jgi:hypothetical protein
VATKDVTMAIVMMQAMMKLARMEVTTTMLTMK